MASPPSSAERAPSGARSRGERLARLLCAGVLAACDAGSAPAPPPAPPEPVKREPPSAAAQPAKEFALSEAEVRAAVVRTQPDCRVTSVTGNVRFGSNVSLVRGEKLDGKGWLELETGARVLIKHTQTAREWILEGPAVAAFCPSGREQVMLGSGKLQTELGAGVRPGGEVSVGTPFGAVSYGDARLTLVVSDQALVLEPSAGEAWFAAPGRDVVPDARITPGAKARHTRRLRATEALAICAELSKRAEGLARSLPGRSTPGAGPGLGQRAAEHMRARKRARSTCANAAAAVMAELRGQEREDRLRELAGHEQAWQLVPSGPEVFP